MAAPIDVCKKFWGKKLKKEEPTTQKQRYTYPFTLSLQKNSKKMEKELKHRDKNTKTR